MEPPSLSRDWKIRLPGCKALPGSSGARWPHLRPLCLLAPSSSSPAYFADFFCHQTQFYITASGTDSRLCLSDKILKKVSLIGRFLAVLSPGQLTLDSLGLAAEARFQPCAGGAGCGRLLPAPCAANVVLCLYLQTCQGGNDHQGNWRVLQIRAGGGNGTPLQYSCLENPMDGGAWKTAVHGVAEGWTRLSDFTFTFHFHALEKEMATHSSVLTWRIPGTAEPGGLPSMGLHRVWHDWSDLAAAAAAALLIIKTFPVTLLITSYPNDEKRNFRLILNEYKYKKILNKIISKSRILFKAIIHSYRNIHRDIST